MPQVREDRTLGELLGQLSEDMTLLVRQEMALAKAELSDKASRAGKQATSIGTGALVAYLGALSLVAALVLGLIEIGIAPWLSALIVGVAFAVIGYVMLRSGAERLKDIDPKPERTVQTLKDDVQWAKEQRP